MIYRLKTILPLIFSCLVFLNGTPSASDHEDININRDTTYLPYSIVTIQEIDNGVNSKPMSRKLQVVKPEIPGVQDGVYVIGYNPALNFDNPAIIGFRKGSDYSVIDDFPIRLIVNDWMVYDDPVVEQMAVIGVGYKNDSAFAFRLLPERDSTEYLFLATGIDRTGDGRWEPMLNLLLVEDYDYDGRIEAFIYINAGREIYPRLLCCIEIETMNMEWSIPVASLLSSGNFHSCGDSANPGVIFTAYNPKQGAVDEKFSDSFGYLARVNGSGELTHQRITAINHIGNRIIPAGQAGSFFITHVEDFLDPNHVDSSTLRSSIYHISKIDSDGRVLLSVTSEVRPINMMVTECSANPASLLVGYDNNRVVVYDIDLNPIDTIRGIRLGNMQGRIKIKGLDHPGLIFGDGIYSNRLERLAAFIPHLGNVQVLSSDSLGNAESIGSGGGNYFRIARIVRRDFVDLVTIFYVKYQNIFLSSMAVLLISLVVMNYFNRRSRVNLITIARQKKEIEATHGQLNAALNALPDILFETNREGRVFLLRTPRPEILKLQPRNYIGKTVADVFSPEAAEVILEAIERASISGRHMGASFVLEVSGKKIWFDLSIAAKGDIESSDCHYIVLARDITNRKKVEDALKESEEKYRNLIELSPDPIVIVQGGWHRLVNRAFYQVFGYTEKDFKEGISSFQLIRDKDLIEIQRQFQLRIKSEADSKVSYIDLVAKDGHLISCEASVSMIEFVGQPALMMIIRDVSARKRIEEALAVSERKFRTLAEELPNMIFIRQSDRIVYVNHISEVLLGYSREEFYAPDFNFLSVVAPESLEVVKSNVARHDRNEEIEPYEYTLITRDNRKIEAILTTRLIDYEGKPAVLGISTDITERKQAEKRQKLLSSAVEQSTDGIAVVDIEGKIIFLNQAFAKLHGYMPGELVGKNLSIFHNKDQMPSVMAANEQTLADGTFYGEIWHTRKDGTVFPSLMHNSIMRDENGEAIGIIGTMRDITDLKATEEALKKAHRDLEIGAEKALRLSEKKYRLLVKNVRAAIIVIDYNGKYLFANEVAAEDAGKPLDKFIGNTLWDNFDPEIADQHLVRIRNVIDTGEDSAEEIQMFVRNSLRWFEVNAHTFADDQGLVNSVMVIAYDINERKVAEEKVRASEQELYQQAKYIAGGVAHEINNSLCPALISLDKLRQRLELDGKEELSRNRELLSLSEEAVKRAINMTDLVTAYSRLESEKEDGEVFLRQVLNRVVTDNSLLIGREAARINIDVDEQISVLAHDRHIYSLFNNMMLNALEAGSEVKGKSDLAIDVSCRRVNKHLRIEFSDNGPGISADILPRVFDVFFSTKPATGTGLGLAMSKKIVALYGGEINVESELDKGCKFIILWPQSD